MKKSAVDLDENMKLPDARAEGAEWHDPRRHPFEIAGFPWLDRDGVYRRLPVMPQHPIRDSVDALANCTAGGQIRFRTNTRELRVSVKLAGAANMVHMPATGQCGFDCYIGGPGKQRYAGTTRYDPRADEYEAVLFGGLERRMRDVTMYFPLYQGVNEVRIGLSPGAALAPPRPFGGDGRIVFYGTSITQGGCASRPGMAYPNILGRRLNRECVNLGFSGNGKGEPELARLILEIERLELLVLDYVPNVSFAEYRDTLPEFIETIRRSRPTLPILVVSQIPYAMDAFNESTRRKRVLCRDFGRSCVEERRRGGDAAIAFLNGDALLGRRYDEWTVDGVHPTDAGFQRIADAMLQPIRAMLGNGSMPIDF